MTPLRVSVIAAAFVAVLSPACAFGQAIDSNAPATHASLTLPADFFARFLVAPAESSSSLPDDPGAALMQQAGAQGQTAPAPQAAEAGAPQKTETDEERRTREREEGEEQVKREEHQRNFGVIPNFNTVIGGKVPPLTKGEKFDLMFHTTTDPYTFAIAFVVAGFGELSPPNQGYHWGATGYFYRLGTAYGDNVDGALWGNAILPVLLRQDPRYYRKGTGSVKSRIVYSALSTIICHGDNGNRQFSYSNVIGNLIAGAISNVYYPHEQRGVGLVFSNGLTVTAEGAVGAQLLEFAPDISAYFRKRHERQKDIRQQQTTPKDVTKSDEL